MDRSEREAERPLRRGHVASGFRHDVARELLEVGLRHWGEVYQIPTTDPVAIVFPSLFRVTFTEAIRSRDG